MIRAQMDVMHRGSAAEQRRLDLDQERLLRQRAKLLEAHYADAVPLDDPD